MNFRPYSLSQLYALPLPDQEYVIDDLLPRGALTLFAAREKSGKTMLSTDAACSIASDSSFLDREIRPGPVIFIPLEEHLREPRDRFKSRLNGRDDVPLFVLPGNGYTDDIFQLDNPACMDAFGRMIEELEAVAVFIDTMREAHQLRENESDDMAALARPLRQIAHEKNCAIVLLHHMSRAGNARGSTAIAASADQLWLFERTDDEAQHESGSPVGRLTVKGRFGPEQRLGIRLGDNLRWQVDNAIREPVDPTIRDRILSALRSSADGLTAREITDHLGANTKLKTVQNELSNIQREDRCPLFAKGTGRRNDPRRYVSVERELFPPPETLGESSGGINNWHSSHASGNNGSNSRELSAAALNGQYRERIPR